MWNLSNKNPEEVEKLIGLSKEQVDKLPEEGDGKAEFLGNGTEEEYKEFQKEEEGMKGWYQRLKDL